MLSFFFRHYDPIVDRYFIYDNHSNDRSLEILKQHPKVEVREFHQSDPNSFVISHQIFHNEVWKESRGQADWVILTAIDEHLEVQGSQNLAYLKSCASAKVTAVPALGFQMVSDLQPANNERLASSRTIGAPWDLMNKLSVFNPGAILETNFSGGRHTAKLVGEVHFPVRDELMLLHYKYLGFERTISRQRALAAKLGSTDRANNWGWQYFMSRDQFHADWEKFKANSVDISAHNFRPFHLSNRKRWWRPP